MRGASRQPGNQDASHSNVYSVLLHHYVPSFTGPSKGSTPASAASTPLQRDVALHARFKIRHSKLCLILTYDPCQASRALPTSTPTTQPQLSGFSEFSSKRRSSNSSRGNAGSPSTNGKSAHGGSAHRSGSVESASQPHSPATLVDPHRHPKQYYVVELQAVSPLAAQLPLSAELRAHLRLNLVDGEAATYSSHSTPRATGASMNSGATSAAGLASNFYFPPNRSPPVMSRHTRHNSPSAHFTAPTAPAYGQYLNAEEPYKVHSRSRQNTPQSRSGLQSRQRSCSLGEGDLTMIHESRPPSGQPSKNTSLVLVSQREAPVSEKNSGLDDVSTPQTLLIPMLKADALADYADLLLVAFFGVAIAAGVPNMSFTTDPQGEVLVEKKKKKMSSRPWHKSLFKWFVPSKAAEVVPPRRSVSTLSSFSAVISSSSGSPQATPAQPNAPSTLPARAAKKGKSSSSSASTPKRVSSLVSAASAHVDPLKVLELPFTLNKHDTFHLRFLCEEDLHDFLARYVELQTRLREAERAKHADSSSPLWHPPVRNSRFGEDENDEEVSEDRRSSSDDGVGGFGFPNDGEEGADEFDEGCDTGSTATYSDYPRNAEALGEGDGGDDVCYGGDQVSIGPSRIALQSHAAAEASRGTRRQKGAGTNATTAAATPPTVFFRSRGWEEYLRYTLDPRFGVPFATVPLYLWHSFLPLSKLVLYTCHRGFLIVERVPPEAAQSDREVLASDLADMTDSERTLELGRQRLNALVNRLLTPIRTAQSPPRHPPPAASSANRHGVVEVLPVKPLPLNDARSRGGAVEDCEDSGNSSGAASWDTVKLVLPSTDEASGKRTDDHFTTVKDVFLCLSESHLLFMNSFGHLRFQCSLDEIALITYSAATAAFPTYPFFRFRLKSGDYFGAPTFVLTFTLLSDVPHDIRAMSLGRFQEMYQAQQQRHAGAHPRTPSAASSASTTPSADDGVCLLADDEKSRLLQRHGDFLRVLGAVCPRPLEFHTFAEMIAAELGRGHRVGVSQLTTASQANVTGSQMARFESGHAPAATVTTSNDGSPTAMERGRSWMALNYNENPILCVKVEADDIELYDAEARAEGRSKMSACISTATQYAVSTSSGQRDSSRRRRSKMSMPPETRFMNPARSTTPRWGYGDPGLVLEDGGRDMDFSLEVATRTMPLMATKAEVHAGYGSNMASRQPSFLPDGPENVSRNDGAANNNIRVADLSGAEMGKGDFFVPVAPKKKKSVILHREALEDA